MAKASGSTRTSKGIGETLSPVPSLPFDGDKKSVKKQISDDFWKNAKVDTHTIHFGRGVKKVTVDDYSYSLGGYSVSVHLRDDSEFGKLTIKDSQGNTVVERVNSGVTKVAMPDELYRLIYTGDKTPHIRTRE